MSDMECRGTRLALGVYVLGAIDPAERSQVDAHLSRCPACREELAGLAGLPALLGRVPNADAELLTAPGAGPVIADEPRPELLPVVLGQVAARRKARRWRGLTAAAAAVIIAAGGGALLGRDLTSPAAVPAADVAFAADSGTHVSAVVDYGPAARGTGMRVKVSGIPAGQACHFWVLDAAGRRHWAGGWTITSSYGTTPWYPASSPLTVPDVTGFEITSAGRVLVRIPAT